MATLALTAAPAMAGPVDTPLSLFPDGQPSHLVAVYTGAVKRSPLQTDFVCTASGAAAIGIGVEIFASDGSRLNDIATGAGAVLGVAPGQTVTIGMGASAALLETTVISLPSVSQGSARVVASAPGAVDCVALMIDGTLAPPTAVATLGVGQPMQAIVGAPAPIPRFADGQIPTHALVVPGIVKRNGMDSDVFCTSLASMPVDIGVQVFAADGSLQNDIATGNGALLGVAPGVTVTFGTTGTAAFLESTVISLPGIAQGYARIVATAAEVVCAAVALDSRSTPPAALTELRAFVQSIEEPIATPTLTPTATHSRPTRTSAPTPSPLAGCTGDCSGNDRVTVDEVVKGVRIVLGATGVDACSAFDFNEDTRVEVNEIVRAVNVLLYGCVP